MTCSSVITKIDALTRRVVGFGRTKWAIAALALISATWALPATAATTTVQMLLDTDNNASTGCAVSTANGSFNGVERILETTVVADDDDGYRITQITTQACGSGSFNPPTVISSTVTPIEPGLGSLGASAIESYIPHAYLPATGTLMRVAVVTQGSDGLVGSDALTSVAAGADSPILTAGASAPIQVPAMALGSLLLTAVLLVALLGWARRRGWGGGQMLVIALVSFALSGQLIAAIVRDGRITDWAALTALATAPQGDAPAGVDITSLYSVSENGNVFFRIDVVLNATPKADAQQVTALVGSPLSITLTGDDYENGTLTYQLVTSPQQGSLSGTAPNLIYTPNSDASASDSFTFTVNDGQLTSATATVAIAMTRVATITSADSTIFVPAQANSFSFMANGLPTPALTLTACSPALPTSLSFVDGGDGIASLTGTPSVSEAGDYHCTLNANNGIGAAASQAFTLHVGGAPVFTSAASITAIEGQVFTFAPTVNATPVATSFTQGGTLPSGINFNWSSGNSAQLSGTPPVGQRGSYPISFTASNGIGTPTTQNATLVVTPVNQAPTFVPGSATVSVLEDSGAYSAAWASVIVAEAGYPTSQQVHFEVLSNSNPALFATLPSLSAAGALSFTPAANANGTATLSVVLRDDGGTENGGVDTSAPALLTITVTAVNDAPSFTKGSDVVVNRSAGAQTFANWATAISAGPPDESAQTLSFQLANDNPSLFATPPTLSATGTLSFTPALATPGGIALVSVTLRDNGGTSDGGVDLSAMQQFTITVRAEPVITSADHVTFIVGQAGQFTFVASGYPQPVLSLGACSPTLPTSVSFSNGQLAGTALTGQHGIYSCSLTASNAAGSPVQAFTLTIAETPTAGDDHYSVESGQLLQIAAGSVPPVDLLANDVLMTPPAVLTHFGGGSLGGSVADHTADATVAFGSGGSLTVNADGSFAFTPASDYFGLFEFDYRIGNVAGQAEATVQIDVTRAPVFTGATSASLPIGVASQHSFTAEGWPAPVITVDSCTPALPASISVGASSATGVAANISFSGTPGVSDGGNYVCSLTASNSEGSAAQQITLQVQQPPAFTSANSVTFVADNASIHQISVTGIPTPTLTNAGCDLAGTGLTLNLGNMTISGTADAAAAGTRSCALTATNAAGTAQQSLTINIHALPRITATSVVNAIVGNAISFGGTVTGYPTPTLSSSGNLPAGVNFNPAVLQDPYGGTPTVTGSYPLTLTASNSAGQAVHSYTLNVSCPAISVTHTLPASVNYGQVFASSIPTQTGTPGNAQWSATNLPPGLNIDASSGVISGTPTATGSYSVTLTVAGTAGCSGTSTAHTLAVKPVARSDTFATIVGNMNVNSGAVNFSVLANDLFPAGSTVSVTGSSVGATVNLNPDGTFSYTPPRGLVGNDSFTYTLSSNGQTATGTVTIPISSAVWFIDNAASCGATCDGRQSTPYPSIASFNAVNQLGTVGEPANGHVIHVASGNYSAAALTLRNDQRLLGAGTGAAFSAASGLSMGASQTAPATQSAVPTFNAAAIVLAQNNVVRGLDLSSSSGTSLRGTGVQALQLAEVRIRNIGTSVNRCLAAVDLTGANASARVVLDRVETSYCNTPIKLTNWSAAGEFSLGVNQTAESAMRYSETAIGLSTVGNVQLNRVRLEDSSTAAIKGTTVNNFSLTNSIINGSHGASSGDGSAVVFDLLTGNNVISDSQISGGVNDNIRIRDSSGSLRMNGLDIGVASPISQNDGIRIDVGSASTMDIFIDQSRFMGLDGDSVQVRQLGSNLGVVTVVLQNNAFSDARVTSAESSGRGTVSLSSGSGRLRYRVENNDFTGQLGTALSVNCGRTALGGQEAVCDGLIKNNRVGSATLDSGPRHGSGLEVVASGGATMRTLIEDNTIQQYSHHGLHLQVSDTVNSSPAFHATIRNNTVGTSRGNPSDWPADWPSSMSGVRYDNGVVAGSVLQSCLALNSNSLANAGPLNDIYLSAWQNTRLHIPGYTGVGNNYAAVADYVKQQQSNPTATRVLATIEGDNTQPVFMNSACELPTNLP